jgi:hypothetical protein
MQAGLKRETIDSTLVPYDLSRMEARILPNLINKFGFNTKIRKVWKNRHIRICPKLCEMGNTAALKGIGPRHVNQKTSRLENS